MTNSDKDTKILNKHNLLVKTKYNLTTVEMRTYLFILYKAQSLSIYKKNELLVESEFVSFYMDREEFRYIRDGNQVLEKARLEKILDNLMIKPIYWEDPDSKTEKWSKFCFIGKQKYDITNDRFKILLPIEVYNMLTKYLEDGYGYTPENLSILLAAKCTYTYRLYELLRLWSNYRNEIEYSIEELKDLFMLENKKSYSTYANLKNKVIIPAKNELEELNLFEIIFKENKKGQKVMSITFKVKDLDTRRYFDKKEEKNGIRDPSGSIYNTNESEKILNIVKKELYIPDETLFTKGTLVLFKRDFREYDFREDFLEDIFYEAYAVTVEKDSIVVIDTKVYKLFKQILVNKLNNYFGKEHSKNNITKDEIVYKKTKFHNFTETISRYSEEELDRIIENSQMEKFNK